ncbi:hypothetical protein E4U15_006734 [Claviceps sp. LM218 group G6]|nr:hypothetical protein E4U15_006734 [Claviceps sp. LM218 group G6]
MNSISFPTPSQAAQPSASAEVERGLIDYLVDQLQKCNNLSAVPDDAQCAQLKTQLDRIGNTLTDVQGTATAIQRNVTKLRGEVRILRDGVIRLRGQFSNIEQDIKYLQGSMKGMIEDVRVIREQLVRRGESFRKMILNLRVDSRSKKSGQDPAKVNIRLKTS